MKWLMGLTAAAVVAFGLTGCVVHAHPYVPPAHHRVVVVDRGHVCHDGCDHYCHEGRWYVVEKHHHGAGCGHVLRGGVWVIVP